MKLELARTTLRNNAPRARALRALRGWINEGVLRAGDVLPAERDISMRLGVGLATVQRAIRVMEKEGLVTRCAGRTRTVTAPAGRPSGMLADAILVIAEAVDMRPGQPVYGWGGYVGAGALHALGECGLHATLISPRHLNETMLRTLLESRPRGLIVPEVDLPCADMLAWLKTAAASGVPTVVFGDERGTERFDRVVPDHRTGSYALTQWLLGQGRRAIRQYWTARAPSRWAEARREGYEQAMREAGLVPLTPIRRLRGVYPELPAEELFLLDAQADAGAMIPYVLGAEPMDAIMVDTDGNVAALAAALKMMGKIPNQDVTLVGYDDYWDQATSRSMDATPPAASVNKRNFECGRALLRLLRERLDGQLPPEPQVRLVEPTLCVRGAEPVRSVV